MPVIWNDGRHQTESNAILLSLAKKASWGLVADPSLQADITTWLFYQASAQGPYFGQIEYWNKLAKQPNTQALTHLRTIANRTIQHLDDQFSSGERAIHRAVTGLRVVEVQFSEDKTRNINTPKDLSNERKQGFQ